MIYVITGRDRSGTSMLTRAMTILTGLPVIRDMAAEDIIRSRVNPDYPDDPNPNGYYQAGNQFPHMVPDNSVIKVPMWRWGACEPVPTRMHIIWTTRDEVERQQSMTNAFGNDERMLHVYEAMEEALVHRDDIETLTKITFADCLDHPDAVLDLLRVNGWPLPDEVDPVVLADLFNVDLWRNRQ